MTLEREAADWFARMRGPDAEASRDAFEAWYAVPANAQAFERQVRAWDTTMFLANTPTGKERNLDRAKARRVRGLPWLLVASVTLAMGLGVALFVREAPASRNGTVLARLESVALDQPPRQISLPDGSRVLLDRGARLQISFGTDQRRLTLLAGRARFAVAHHDRRAFVVDAGDGRVIAHGTLFDVNVMPAGVDVALLEGAVEVKNCATGAGRGGIRLAAGHHVAVTRGAITEPAALRSAEQQWPADMLAFDGVELVDAVAAFNRTSARPVAIGATTARAMKVTGAFRRSDPEGFARQLAATFGLKIENRSDGSLALVQR